VILFEDYNQFGEINKIGPSKIESLLVTFKGNFNPNKKIVQKKQVTNEETKVSDNQD